MAYFGSSNRFKIPIVHSTKVKEECPRITLVLNKYNEYKWVICVDLQMVNFFWYNKEAILNILILYVYGIAELTKNIGQEKNVLLGKH